MLVMTDRETAANDALGKRTPECEKSRTADTEHNKTNANARYNQWFVSVYMAKEILLSTHSFMPSEVKNC